MSNQPIEALLRPPVEISSVITNTALGIVAISAPQILMMPGGVGYTVGTACLLRAAWLAARSVKLKTYQRGLHVLPPYEINPSHIKKDEEELSHLHRQQPILIELVIVCVVAVRRAPLAEERR